jgi:hypothetical protein
MPSTNLFSHSMIHITTYSGLTSRHIYKNIVPSHSLSSSKPNPINILIPHIQATRKSNRSSTLYASRLTLTQLHLRKLRQRSLLQNNTKSISKRTYTSTSTILLSSLLVILPIIHRPQERTLPQYDQNTSITLYLIEQRFHKPTPTHGTRNTNPRRQQHSITTPQHTSYLQKTAPLPLCLNIKSPKHSNHHVTGPHLRLEIMDARTMVQSTALVPTTARTRTS